MVVFTFLAIFTFAQLILAYDPTDCLNGVQTGVTAFVFSDTTNYYTSLCTGNLTLTSVWAAAKVYCTPNEIEQGSVQLAGYCQLYGPDLTLIPYDEFEPEFTPDFLESLPLVTFEDTLNTSRVWNTSILLSNALYKTALRTVTTFDHEYATHTLYGWAFYGLWAGVLLFGMVNHLVTYILEARISRSRRDEEGTLPARRAKSKSNSVSTRFSAARYWIRTHLIIPIAFGTHHQQLKWGCALPTRMEGVVLFAYYTMSIILSSVSYEVFMPNLYYNGDWLQSWRYIADRTGILCYANLPLLWMFSGRNNIFLWATGWHFSSFNRFHRAIARVSVLMAITHSIAFSVMEIHYGDYDESWTENYWYMGGIATVSMSLIVLFSSNFVRQKAYEFFLIVHIILSVAVLVGLFYHTATSDGVYNQWNGYLWTAAAIWCFDRFLRLFRQIYCNVHIKFSKGIKCTTTTVTYSQKSNLLRLEVVPGSTFLKPKPGQHYFLYQPLQWKGWENHPFTLADWSTPDNAKTTPETVQVKAVKPEENHRTFIKAGPSTTENEKSSSVIAESTDSTLEEVKLTFLARPYSGWTKRLRNSCLKAPDGTTNANFLLEGPYGETAPLYNYENLLFITGGSGISAAMPYLRDHVHRKSSRTTRTNNISLHWTSKQDGMIHDITNHEIRTALGSEDVQAFFYSTGGDGSAITSTVIDSQQSSVSSQTVDITPGRPNIRKTVLDFVTSVGADGSAGGRIALLVCGPAAMADAARVAVHQALKAGYRNVEYFEEAFGW